MADFLVFQLYGTLAAWGDIAVGEYRPGLGHPTKSAITGLLAAALGIDREDEAILIQISQHYGTAVCVRTPGELLRDYHTVQVPGGKREYASRRDELQAAELSLNTILSWRDYRMDALYQIAIWQKRNAAIYSLEEIQQKLKQPKYNLYLGRKACPVSLPLYPIMQYGVSLKQAFTNYPLHKAAAWTDSLTSSRLVSYFWEQDNLNSEELGMDSSMTYPRRDQVISRKRWQFSNRDECYYGELSGEEI